ncbi:DNA-binding transcriptional MerR regulator [Paraburkholderia sp. GAS199]|uniref:MerR family transcriptional regulator n=1 Tax=Paraburkholderia sp. GAS199 TaxID=3035126 RepID=UPI003D210837
MQLSLGIGDFARATHLSVKTLRHYHETGVLVPVEVDAQTGYRRYGPDQIATAQVIRRFRALDMPLEDIRAVLGAQDIEARSELISAHLERLESELARTQSAVASLRGLLQPAARMSASIEQRTVDAAMAASITQIVDIKDALLWFQGAIAELYATLAAQQVPVTGSAGGIYSNALFLDARGEATIFVPCAALVRSMGRVQPLVVPQVELATIIHAGAHTDIDLAYGALASYVTQHALAIDAPIREYYLVGARETADATLWRTEIGWPIFQTVV